MLDLQRLEYIIVAGLKGEVLCLSRVFVYIREEGIQFCLALQFSSGVR